MANYNTTAYNITANKNLRERDFVDINDKFADTSLY